jgi:hypothetical protein
MLQPRCLLSYYTADKSLGMKTSIKWMIDYLVDITTIGTPKITGYEKWLFNIKYINKTIQKCKFIIHYSA